MHTEIRSVHVASITCQLPCLSACEHCNGTACENADNPDIEELTECDLDETEVLMTNDNKLIAPDDCVEFDLQWLDEETVETLVYIR